VDPDACADAARPSLLSNLFSEAALGRRLIQGGLGQWIPIPCFRLCCQRRAGAALDSRGFGAVDLDAYADAARSSWISTLLYGAARGRRLNQGVMGQWVSTLVQTLHDISCI
jgi:hypothetical protein